MATSDLEQLGPNAPQKTNSGRLLRTGELTATFKTILRPSKKKNWRMNYVLSVIIVPNTDALTTVSRLLGSPH